VAESVVEFVVESAVGSVVGFVVESVVGSVVVFSQRAVGPAGPEVGTIVLLLQHHVSSSTYSQVPLWTQV